LPLVCLLLRKIRSKPICHTSIDCASIGSAAPGSLDATKNPKTEEAASPAPTASKGQVGGASSSCCVVIPARTRSRRISE